MLHKIIKNHEQRDPSSTNEQYRILYKLFANKKQKNASYNQMVIQIYREMHNTLIYFL